MALVSKRKQPFSNDYNTSATSMTHAVMNEGEGEDGQFEYLGIANAEFDFVIVKFNKTNSEVIAVNKFVHQAVIT